MCLIWPAISGYAARNFCSKVTSRTIYWLTWKHSFARLHSPQNLFLTDKHVAATLENIVFEARASRPSLTGEFFSASFPLQVVISKISSLDFCCAWWPLPRVISSYRSSNSTLNIYATYNGHLPITTLILPNRPKKIRIRQRQDLGLLENTEADSPGGASSAPALLSPLWSLPHADPVLLFKETQHGLMRAPHLHRFDHLLLLADQLISWITVRAPRFCTALAATRCPAAHPEGGRPPFWHR
jgi:hypothetical protein